MDVCYMIMWMKSMQKHYKNANFSLLTGKLSDGPKTPDKDYLMKRYVKVDQLINGKLYAHPALPFPQYPGQQLVMFP